MVWDWLPTYMPLLINGLWITLTLLILSTVIGMIFAVPLALVQALQSPYLATPARAFCTFIRGTPLLVQLWLLYFGLGSLFPMIPGIRQSFLWPVLREGYFYALLAFIISVAGYEGEIMRGAFLGVPKGELEAAKAFGMSPWKVFRRIWFPRAFRLALPVLAGETAGSNGDSSRSVWGIEQDPARHLSRVRTASAGSRGLCGALLLYRLGVPLV
jgi:polar amino acid transport system permease protein